jgi:hypothetical protein
MFWSIAFGYLEISIKAKLRLNVYIRGVRHAESYLFAGSSHHFSLGAEEIIVWKWNSIV